MRVTNGFDGIDWDDEDGSQTTASVASCYEALAAAAHAATSQAGKPLLMSSLENQSIPTSNPYSANATDFGSSDSVVNEFYGYNPANNWNCGQGSPWGTCAFVTQLDGTVIKEGIPASKTVIGMSTCCGNAQAAYQTFSTTSETVDTSGPVTSLPLATALTAAIPAGNVVLATGSPVTNYEVFSTSGAASGATSIPITGTVRGSGPFAFPAGASVQSDYQGAWDCYNLAAYAKANGYQGNMDFALQTEYGDYNKSFPCLAQIGLGLGLTH